MSEETIFDSSEVIEDRPNTEIMDSREMDQSQYSDQETLGSQDTVDEQAQEMEPEAPQEKKRRGGGVAAAAGIAGLAGAALGVLSPKFVFPDEPDNDDQVVVDEPEEPEVDNNDVQEHPADLQGHDLNVATGVNDDMSYGEAFAAARQEVGAGGVFVWHGHTYGTYYGSEWNSMSPDEKDQYWADVNHTTSHIDYDEPDPQPDPNSDPVVLELHEDDIYAVYDVDGDGVADAAVVDANGNAIPDVIMDTTGDGHFDTLLVDPDENFDGDIVEIAGVDVIPDQEVAPDNDNLLILNEDEVYAAVDVNDDGVLDSVIVDANGNETLDLVVDTDGDGVVDTLVLDPVVDNDDIYVDQQNVYGIDGVVLTPDDGLVNDDDYLANNMDVDSGSSVPFDADITIDNDMDMGDFV